METGRALPSREMVLRLAEQLEVPLRERNVLLVAAGFAPVFKERRLEDQALLGARKAVDLILAGHEPYPALALDRHWTMLACNGAVAQLITGADATLLQPPVNVLRLSLHPKGLAPRIANLPEWRAHLLARLRRQIEVSADAVLGELLRELMSYPAPNRPLSMRSGSVDELAGVAVPFKFMSAQRTLSFLSTTTVFGTPLDITLSELALEFFFPADQETADALRAMAASPIDGR